MALRNWIQSEKPDFGVKPQHPKREYRMYVVKIFGEQNLPFQAYEDAFEKGVTLDVLAWRRLLNPAKWLEFLLLNVGIVYRYLGQFVSALVGLAVGIALVMTLGPFVFLFGAAFICFPETLAAILALTLTVSYIVALVLGSIFAAVVSLTWTFAEDFIKHFVFKFTSPIDGFIKPLINAARNGNNVNVILAGLFYTSLIASTAALILTGAFTLPTLASFGIILPKIAAEAFFVIEVVFASMAVPFAMHAIIQSLKDMHYHSYQNAARYADRTIATMDFLLNLKVDQFPGFTDERIVAFREKLQPICNNAKEQAQQTKEKALSHSEKTVYKTRKIIGEEGPNSPKLKLKHLNSYSRLLFACPRDSKIVPKEQQGFAFVAGKMFGVEPRAERSQHQALHEQQQQHNNDGDHAAYNQMD